jgi:hypothetical protein
MGGHIVHMGEMRNAYNILVGKPEGKRPLGRPRHRWESNIKMDLIETEFGGVDWINLAQNRDWWWGSCEHGNEPWDSINEREFLDWLNILLTSRKGLCSMALVISVVISVCVYM